MVKNPPFILVLLHLYLFIHCTQGEEFLCDEGVIFDPFSFNVSTRVIDLPYANNLNSSLFAVDDDPLSDCVIRLGYLYFWEKNETDSWSGKTITIQGVSPKTLTAYLKSLDYLAPNNNLISQLQVVLPVPVTLSWIFNITYLNLDLPPHPQFTAYIVPNQDESSELTKGIEVSENGEVSISTSTEVTDITLDIIVVGPPLVIPTIPSASNTGLTRDQFIVVVVCSTIGGSIVVVAIVILISIKGRRGLHISPTTQETPDVPLESIPKPTHIIT